MFFQFDNLPKEEYLESHTTIHQDIQQIFIKTILKKFIDGPQKIFLILSEKGQSIAYFDTYEECQYFAYTHDLNYQLIQ